MIKTTNARYNHPVSSSNYLPSRIKAILKYQDLSCHNLINTCTQIQNKKLLIIRKNVKNNSVLRISHQKMINVAPQNFSSGSHNGQFPMAHNQLVRILNGWSWLKCRAPESLLEVVTTTRIKRCGRRNVELSLAPMWINSFLTLSYRKRYRSLRKTNVENEKLFDVNDLPEADQK